MALVSSDMVAIWSVSLPDGMHQVKFEHGTTTGKRVIWIDNKEMLRKNWMFKLVGRLDFYIGSTKALITIDAISGFSYEYTLFINGKPLQKFIENRKKTAKVWTLSLDNVETRIVLGVLWLLQIELCNFMCDKTVVGWGWHHISDFISSV